MVAVPDNDRPDVRPVSTRRLPYIIRRRQHREAATRRLLDRVIVPILATRRPDDPIDRPRHTGSQRLLKALVFLGLALLIHVGGVGVALVAARLNTVHVHPEEQVVIELREEPPLPAVEPPAPAPAPVAPIAPIVTKVEPRAAKPVEPPPDPTTPVPPPPAAQVEPPKQAPVRVVGLSLDSTAAGGSGPGFAVGNTRMGETADRAASPTAVQPLSAAPVAAPNRTATRIPTAGVTLLKPERKGNRPPPYPELLRQQGIEAEVVVVVSIDAQGKVTGVTIAKGSTYPEFNDAAKAAALAEEFTPATKNGEPVPYSLKYTYFFRLTET